MTSPNICEHGSLKRSCLLCELQSELRDLKDQLAAARVVLERRNVSVPRGAADALAQALDLDNRDGAVDIIEDFIEERDAQFQAGIIAAATPPSPSDDPFMRAIFANVELAQSNLDLRLKLDALTLEVSRNINGLTDTLERMKGELTVREDEVKELEKTNDGQARAIDRLMDENGALKEANTAQAGMILSLGADVARLRG